MSREERMSGRYLSEMRSRSSLWLVLLLVAVVPGSGCMRLGYEPGADSGPGKDQGQADARRDVPLADKAPLVPDLKWKIPDKKQPLIADKAPPPLDKVLPPPDILPLPDILPPLPDFLPPLPDFKPPPPPDIYLPAPDMKPPPLDSGPPPTCPTSPTASGWSPRVVWKGQQFAMTYRKTVGGKSQVHLSFLDNKMKMVTPPGEIDVQEVGSANSQGNQLAVGPGGQLGLVWTQVHSGQPTSLVFQRVSPAGVKLGKNLTLVTGKLAPSIAYNTVDQEYAVVWAGGFTRISATTGAMVGGVVPFGISGAPAMVYNTKDKRYAILHANISGANLFFAFRDPSGKHVGSSTVYTATAAYKVDNNGSNNPSTLAYNATHNEYGVAFRLRPKSGGTVYTASVEFLQVNTNGYATSKVTAVNLTELGLKEPALQWNGTTWGMAFTLVGPKQTRLQHLNRKGIPVTPMDTMSCTTSVTRMYPDLAWNGSRWGLVWNELSGLSVMARYWIP